MATFPEGQIVAVDGDNSVVAVSSCMRFHSKRFDPLEKWAVVTAYGTIRTHESGGDALYGVDTMVSPERRCRGIGTSLMVARLDLARALGVRMIRTGARLAGYRLVAHRLTPVRYVTLVEARRITDPSLSFLLRFGYRVKGVAEEYIERDAESAGCAAILELELS